MPRRPKPTALRLVEGNKSRRPLPKAEPKPRRCIPSPPDHLSKEARLAWGVFATKLDRIGVLTELDGAALEQACELYAEIVALRADLATGRVQVVETVAGADLERPRPQVAMLQRAVSELRAWLAEFGMTPSSRTKVSALADETGEDAAEAFFKHR